MTTLSLSTNSSKIEEQLKNYAENIIVNKTRLFVQKLADYGIEVANANTVTSLVMFYKEVNNTSTGCKAMVVGADKFKIVSQWVKAGGEIGEAEVSPLLMAEFGSGWNAENPQNIEGYGQGTFPNQTHAFDVGGWSWMDLDGNWHHSDGMSPTMPMYNAWLEMYANVERIAKEVFENG